MAIQYMFYKVDFFLFTLIISLIK